MDRTDELVCKLLGAEMLAVLQCKLLKRYRLNMSLQQIYLNRFQLALLSLDSGS